MYDLNTSFPTTTASRIYYSHYDIRKKDVVEDDVTLLPEYFTPEGYFKIKIKSGEKNRFLQIKDLTSNLQDPLIDYVFAGWVDYSEKLPVWAIVLIVVGSVLVVGLIILAIYCIRNKNRLRGTGPEYSNLTELPVQPMPDTP